MLILLNFFSGKVPLPTVAVDFSETRRSSRKKKQGKVWWKVFYLFVQFLLGLCKTLFAFHFFGYLSLNYFHFKNVAVSNEFITKINDKYVSIEKKIENFTNMKLLPSIFVIFTFHLFFFFCSYFPFYVALDKRRMDCLQILWNVSTTPCSSLQVKLF